MANVSRADILDLLAKWEAGELDAQSVHERAEALWAAYDGPRDLPDSDADSLVVEAISQLEILNQQLITSADVPAFRKFLTAPTGGELDAWRVWRGYWDRLDTVERKKSLAGVPYYPG